MSKATSNYQFIKEDEEDFYDISIINDNLDKIDMAIKEASESGGSSAEIGDLEALLTTDKTSLVAAVNECFQYASDGKRLLATTITGKDKTIVFPENSTFKNLESGINQLVFNKDESALTDRIKVRTAILEVENTLTITSKPSAIQLANTIVTNLISRKKGAEIATGAGVSSSSTIEIVDTSNSRLTTFYLQVSGLSFTPKKVFIYEINEEFGSMAFLYDGINRHSGYGTYYGGNSGEKVVSLSSVIYLANGEFKLPVSKKNTSYYYIATT